MQIHKITCILPVYNNEETVEKTVKVLLSVPDIFEIIAIDDGSTDSTYKILQKYRNKIIILRNIENLGKGGAFVKALSMSKGDLVFTCDADLKNLRVSHVENIISTYQKGGCDMVLGAREGNLGWGALMARITGERIFEKKTIERYESLISKSRYGMEQIINHAHRGKKVKVVVSKDIGHIHKFRRRDFPKWLAEYIFQVGQMLKTAKELSKHR